MLLFKRINCLGGIHIQSIQTKGTYTGKVNLHLAAHLCEVSSTALLLLAVAFWPRHGISYNVVTTCATSKASDQPAHTRSLIRAFASRLNIL